MGALADGMELLYQSVLIGTSCVLLQDEYGCDEKKGISHQTVVLIKKTPGKAIKKSPRKG